MSLPSHFLLGGAHGGFGFDPAKPGVSGPYYGPDSTYGGKVEDKTPLPIPKPSVVGDTALRTDITPAEKELSNWKDRNILNVKRLIFPTELVNLDRPIMEIRCLQAHSIIPKDLCIYLPAPEGLAYSNSSTYNDAELGIMGNAALDAINIGKNSSSLDQAMAGLNRIKDEAWANASTNFKNDPKTAILAAISAGLGGSDEGVKGAVKIAAGARFNPYIVTAFDGTDTREYSFEYKLIPSSSQESEIIKTITKVLQIGVYGEVSGFLLKYPPKWRITILSQINDEGNLVLKPMSSFYECYLSGCDVTYNSSNNSYFTDNSPFETDIRLSFKETKALHANEIAKQLTV